MAEDQVRHSKAAAAALVTDEDEKAKLEARNALLQFDVIDQMVDAFIRSGRPFRLRPSAFLELHRAALEGLSAYAGNWRPADVAIGGSKHRPPGAYEVPTLVEDLCDHVNEEWQHASAIRLSAYVLWRTNWVHPFVDGNGRTARAAAYYVLCARLGMHLPGIETIPDQIIAHRAPYYEALEDADTRWQETETVDTSRLEDLLDSMLAKQLVSVHAAATKDRS